MVPIMGWAAITREHEIPHWQVTPSSRTTQRIQAQILRASGRLPQGLDHPGTTARVRRAMQHDWAASPGWATRCSTHRRRAAAV